MAEEKRLMKGNEAMGEAAVRAGCDAYFGYPITPQNELTAYMAKHMLDKKRTFIQAESEVAAINMVFGAGATGARVMTSSSSPGVSLKQEGISYACGADVPCVVINVSRSGPGLGGISPAQGDYFQSTRGGGHGDYYHIVLAPKSVQEAADLTYEAFDLADQWRMPAMVLADGMIGQMMEGVSFKPPKDPATRIAKPWAVGTSSNRPVNHVDSTHLDPDEFEAVNRARFERYAEMKKVLPRYEEHDIDDAELVLVAYGTSARVSYGAVQMARKLGIKAGLFRPITLWPFPEKRMGELADAGKKFLAVEMSMGQMVEDVRLYTHGKSEVFFYGRCGGNIPTEEAVLAEIQKILKK
ncbi:MAG: 3-methyl-2-oxobutanoate dehydrogenase subunit VorB [Spirochaetales bacterium]|nr:3-methyl-2-oxobutanoate dehydrogenase subunit VorB [Spirochaetales bacterium]